MDKFMKYMKETKYKLIGSDVELVYFPRHETVLVFYMDEVRETNSEDDMLDMIYEKELPFRICSLCGKPMQDGYVDDDEGVYICCTEEFFDYMNREFGETGWRYGEDEAVCYEVFLDGEWTFVNIYWTAWY